MIEFIAGTLLATSVFLVGIGVYAERHKPKHAPMARPRWKDIARK